MDPYYLPDYLVFIFDGKNNFETWRSMIKDFFKNIGVWNIIQKGFTEPIASTELSSDAIQQLKKNEQLNYKALYYLYTQVQLHVVKKFIHVKTAKETWKFLINSYGRAGEEEICDEEKENEYFDESKKEEIAEIVSAHEDEEFMTQKEISQVIEKEG